MRLQVWICILLQTQFAFAGIDIPTGLDENDRSETLEILGAGTSTKILTEPYPLGGYSGVEVGVTVESIPTEDLSRLGEQTEDQDTLVYPKLTIGKGLYNNIDGFLNFVPYNESTNISQFGGLVKWSFYQATFMPASFSLAVFGNDTNIRNKVFVQTAGYALVTGITMKYLSIYFAAGQSYSTGQFVGGTNGITQSGDNEKEDIKRFFFTIGGVLKVDPVFVAIEMSQYTVPVMSGKIGIKF